MSNFKGFSEKATKDEEASKQAQANEHTEANKDSNKQTSNPSQQPAADQTDKGVQPNHNTPKPS